MRILNGNILIKYSTTGCVSENGVGNKFEPTSNRKAMMCQLDELLKSKIYWYPGGGADITPLLLLSNSNLLGKSALEKDCRNKQDRLLLWITDIRDLNANAIAIPAYTNLWSKFYTTYDILNIDTIVSSCHNCLSKTFAIDVRISRPAGVSTYIMLYSKGDARDCPELFRRMGADIDCACFVGVSDFGGSANINTIMPLLDNYKFSPNAIVADSYSDPSSFGYVRLGSRDTDWVKGTPHISQRVHTGGVHGWGYGTASLWPRSDLYDQFLCRLQDRRCGDDISA